MQIRDMFAKDINRSINGVVKVAQDDDASIRQELEEYVVTRELNRHFDTLLENYEHALDVPTDKIGVWISGFFGSGKSHFLKMLSYLLSNRKVAGRPAADYFAGKFPDAMMEARIRRCVAVPTEPILFNIDNKGPATKDKTAVLKTFARVFYEHLGYYGEDLRLVKLERFVERQGKTQAFRDAFERINGSPWLAERESYDFFSDDVIAALVETDVMSAEAAQRWFDGSETAELSVDALVDDIREYVDARAAADPSDQFRLLFMVDEVGQYIGGDVNLMLNLQTIVEELGARCAGRVWVMVTSQEAIDEITQGLAGNDFSKIQGRFNTRLSLSSSSVDEVIKARVLAKTDEAADVLCTQYAAQSVVLKNLFTFENSRGDLIGYAGESDFVESFPFASYQFRLMQDVLTEVRRHGSSGKHLSGGERSMLSGFQEAAQKLQDKDQNALVPFWRFYDTLSTFLEGYIRRVIDRCAEAAAAGKGLREQDVSVLKLLFLVRYVDDVRPTLNNLTILMVDDVRADTMALRASVQESLERLERENYIAHSGDLYTFLTDEEQDVAREISEVQIPASAVVTEIGRTLFGEVYTDAKYRCGEGDYAIDRYIDAAPWGKVQNGMVLRAVTVVGDLHDAGDEALCLRSGEPQALMVLDDAADYYRTLQRALQIEQYARRRNLSQLPESTQAIIRGKQAERQAMLREARTMIEAAVSDARFFVAGREVTPPRSASARQKIECALRDLTQATYSKAEYVQKGVSSDAELRAILMGNADTLGDDPNQQAVDEVERFLATRSRLNAQTSMQEVQRHFQEKPYGWRELDVAAAVARLVSQQKATLSCAGVQVKPNDPKAPACLHSRTEIQKTVVSQRVRVPDSVMRAARGLLKELTKRQDVATDEDGLAAQVGEWVNERARTLADHLQADYARQGAYAYPGKGAIERYAALAREVRDAASGGTANLLKAFAKREDDLLDAAEDVADVDSFFGTGQRERFDEAASLKVRMDQEASYLTGEADAQTALAEIDRILVSERPYGRIAELAELCKRVRVAYDALVKEKRRQMLDDAGQVEHELGEYAAEKKVPQTDLAVVLDRLGGLRSRAHACTSLTQLDALTQQLADVRAAGYRAVEEAADAAEAQRERAALASRHATEHLGASEGDRRPVVVPASVAGMPAASPVVSSRVPTAPVPAPKPKDIRELRVMDVLPGKRLSSEEEIDAYVDDLRGRLKRMLAGHDGIRLVK